MLRMPGEFHLSYPLFVFAFCYIIHSLFRKLILDECNGSRCIQGPTACYKVVLSKNPSHRTVNLIVPSNGFIRLPGGLEIGNKRKDYSERRLLG